MGTDSSRRGLPLRDVRRAESLLRERGRAHLLEALAIPANVFDNYTAHRAIVAFTEAASYAEDLEANLQRMRFDYEAARDASEVAHAEMARTQAELARLETEMARVEADAKLAWRTGSLRSGRGSHRRGTRHRAAGGARRRAVAELARAGRRRRRGRRLARARSEVEAVRAALAGIEATRTFRYTAGIRAKYSLLRRVLRLS